MEAVDLTTDGVPLMGVLVVLAFLAASIWDALTAGTPWVWSEPIGVLFTGVALLWWQDSYLWIVGLVLVAVGGGLSLAHRWQLLPRRPRSRRYRLPRV